MTVNGRAPRGRQLSRLLRFVLVGGSVSLAYSVTTSLLVGQAGLPAYATSVVVYLLCIPIAFQLQHRVTFGAGSARRMGVLVYAGTQLASVALVSSVTTRHVTGTFWADTAVFLATAGAAAVVSYIACARLAFRP